jgi:hypothetical protein
MYEYGPRTLSFWPPHYSDRNSQAEYYRQELFTISSTETDKYESMSDFLMHFISQFVPHSVTTKNLYRAHNAMQ